MISELIHDLRFRERQREAEAKLREIGLEALPALREAVNVSSAVQRRALLRVIAQIERDHGINQPLMRAAPNEAEDQRVDREASSGFRLAELLRLARFFREREVRERVLDVLTVAIMLGFAAMVCVVPALLRGDIFRNQGIGGGIDIIPTGQPRPTSVPTIEPDPFRGQRIGYRGRAVYAGTEFITSDGNGLFEFRPAGDMQTITRTLRDIEGRGLSFAVLSPDGSRLATGHRNGALRVFDLDTGETLLARHLYRRIYDMTWSPNSEWVAVNTRHQHIIAYDVLTGDRAWGSPYMRSPISGFTWTDDEDTVYIGLQNGEIYRWQDEDTIYLGDLNAMPFSAVWNASNNTVYMGTVQGTIWAYDGENWESLVDLGFGSWIRGMAISPDGSQIAAMAGANTILVVDLASVETATFRSQREVHDLAWLNNSEVLAAGLQRSNWVSWTEEIR
ncbi:MAG: WD40 repeat domain-containing protein [Anaerolineae bacterium]